MGGVPGHQHELLRLTASASRGSVPADLDPLPMRGRIPPRRRAPGRLRSFRDAALAVALAGALCGAGATGCIARSWVRERSTFPDAAAVSAGAAARAQFEVRNPRYPDPDLASAITGFGERALALEFGPAGPSPGGRDAADPAFGWQFAVTDQPRPEAVLFADRTVFVSRGLLATLGAEERLLGLFAAAVRLYRQGGFRAPDGTLRTQPLAAPLPVNEPAAAAAANGPSDRWLEMIDGLPFGEPAEAGGAAGRELLLPASDLRLLAPPHALFRPGTGGRHAAAHPGGVGEDRLVVEEFPRTPREAPGETLPEDRAATLRLLGDLADELVAGAGAEAVAFTEAFRVGGLIGVMARLAGGEGFAAVIAAPGGRVALRFECGSRPFALCEDSFGTMLESADRLRGSRLPGPLRLRSVEVRAGGPATEVLAALAREEVSDVPAATLFDLNHLLLDRTLAPGDRVLVARRDRLPGSAP